MDCTHALEEGPAKQALTPAPVPTFRAFTATLLLPDFIINENTAQTGNTAATDVIIPSSLLVQTVQHFVLVRLFRGPCKYVGDKTRRALRS